MGQNLDENLKNALFMAAVDYLYKEKMVNSQGELAGKIGISEAALSRIKNNKKTVGDDTLRKMNEAFGGIFNMAYFRGSSTTLLIEDEIYYQQHPDENPLRDFDDMLKKKTTSAIPVAPSAQIPDMSSVFNAAIAAKDDAIESLKRELSTKDDIIQSLREQLQAKDDHIATLKERLVEYRRIIDSRNGISDYPFPIGVAEHKEKRPKI